MGNRSRKPDLDAWWILLDAPGCGRRRMSKPFRGAAGCSCDAAFGRPPSDPRPLLPDCSVDVRDSDRLKWPTWLPNAVRLSGRPSHGVTVTGRVDFKPPARRVAARHDGAANTARLRQALRGVLDRSINGGRDSDDALSRASNAGPAARQRPPVPRASPAPANLHARPKRLVRAGEALPKKQSDC